MRFENGQPAEWPITDWPKYQQGVACQPGDAGASTVTWYAANSNPPAGQPPFVSVRTYHLDGSVLRLDSQVSVPDDTASAAYWQLRCGSLTTMRPYARPGTSPGTGGPFGAAGQADRDASHTVAGWLTNSAPVTEISSDRQLRLPGPDRAQRLLPARHPGRVPDLVAPAARRQRRGARRHPPDAHGGAVLPSGAGLGQGGGGAGRRLQERRAQAPHRRGVPGHPRCGGRGVHGPGGPGPGIGVGGGAHHQGGDPQPGQEAVLRQPLLVPHHGPHLGPRHHQDVGASPVRGPGHAQRSRVRGLRSEGGGDRFHQGRQLLHRG